MGRETRDSSRIAELRPLSAQGAAGGPDLLFVYGTLRRSAGGGMHRLLAGAYFAGEAVWHGRLYIVDGYPGAVPSTDGSLVKGELYRLTEPAATLALLDKYEECSPEFGEETEYVRTVVAVELAGNGKICAWIYIYNRPVDDLAPIESGDFILGEGE